ncbi:MAG: HAD-IA family hydrolase [Clostridiales bacterium]|jgi:phosphoglycolate phosphatase|nr:HAD-IA family hydrolase [Clostridiales bacterium]
MKYKAVFFDLDGTLFDTSAGIYETFDYLFKKHNVRADKSEYRSFIGPPIRLSLERFFDKDTAKDIHDEFRVYYDKYGKFNAKLYDGMENTLKVCKERGLRIYTATSKNQIMSVEITKKFGIYGYFDIIYGADADAGRVNKEDVLIYALAQSEEDPKECLLIGDTLYDVKGAEAVGMDCLAVLYGFGTPQELCGKSVIGYANGAEDITRFI